MSENNRIQANLLNFGTSVSEMTTYLGGFILRNDSLPATAPSLALILVTVLVVMHVNST